jgi:hypothetical protein
MKDFEIKAFLIVRMLLSGKPAFLFILQVTMHLINSLKRCLKSRYLILHRWAGSGYVPSKGEIPLRPSRNRCIPQVTILQRLLYGKHFFKILCKKLPVYKTKALSVPQGEFVAELFNILCRGY